MTDMQDYHISNHLLSTMTVKQLHAAQAKIIENLNELRVMCEGTLISVETYWRMVASERRKYDAIGMRIRQLQGDDTTFDTDRFDAVEVE